MKLQLGKRYRRHGDHNTVYRVIRIDEELAKDPANSHAVGVANADHVSDYEITTYTIGGFFTTPHTSALGNYDLEPCPDETYDLETADGPISLNEPDLAHTVEIQEPVCLGNTDQTAIDEVFPPNDAQSTIDFFDILRTLTKQFAELSSQEREAALAFLNTHFQYGDAS